MWLMKVKESQQFQFLPLMLLIFMLMNFNPISSPGSVEDVPGFKFPAKMILYSVFAGT